MKNRNGRGVRLPAPSLVLLAAMAVACWVAAIRSDRLRLEASRNQRSARLAQAPPQSVDSPEGKIR